MNTIVPDDAHQRKKELRQQARARREALAEKDVHSQRIRERLVALPEYLEARTVLIYLDLRGEVRTRPLLATALGSEQRFIVPWCNAVGELDLFVLTSPDELAVGRFGILEPKPELRSLPAHQVAVSDVDLVLVPGVAFDRRGGRLGHGFGYYDKLLGRMRADTSLVGLAYECQLVPEVPVQEHDVFMDWVVTENAVYRGRGRRCS